jgi:hypothetical protein
MARLIKETYAPSWKTSLLGIKRLKRASLCMCKRRGCRLRTCLHGTHQAAGVQAPPKLSAEVFSVERSNPVVSPGNIQAGETVRRTDGASGKRCWRKQMPFGNRVDTGHTRRESEQTSSGCLLAREFEKPSSMGKQMTAPRWRWSTHG